MTHSFAETLDHFGTILKSRPPKGALESGRVELEIDKTRLVIKQSASDDSIIIEMNLGFFLVKPQKEHLQQLATANFLGVDTGGCTLAFDSAGVTLYLRAVSSAGSSLQECWQWLHRAINVYHHWSQKLSNWKDFTPLSPISSSGFQPRKDLMA
ncbi:MAG: hypothetical protein S4CHLAM81_13750 [Chlamydiales bacterium]|nr:hypothetical protein [Chlamydiales bacterium]MCH9636147.1 hypothetical protein [Chlamydiales bacterium]MCH9703258.1 type III secretion system chaperone [Chlamydiota bacterium]